MVKMGALTKIKTVLIEDLREFFRNEKNYIRMLPKEIRHDSFINMNIYDTNPEQLITFPMIVISGSNGRMVTAGISGDFASELYDDDGNLYAYLYGGMYEFNVEVEIGTRTPLEREVLMDITAMALRFLARRDMERKGILIKELSYGGENKIPYDSDMIYTSVINLQTFSEWYEKVELMPLSEATIDITEQRFDLMSNY